MVKYIQILKPNESRAKVEVKVLLSLSTCPVVLPPEVTHIYADNASSIVGIGMLKREFLIVTFVWTKCTANTPCPSSIASDMLINRVRTFWGVCWVDLFYISKFYLLSMF